MFDEFLSERKQPQKMYTSYLGISKKDYPQWEGWKVIDFFKKQNVHVSEIKSKKLDTLFENFWLIQYLIVINNIH